MRAFKLSRRAHESGSISSVRRRPPDKVARSWPRLREAVAVVAEESDTAKSRKIFEEVGDLLFARESRSQLDVDAEAALRAANVKFETPFSVGWSACRDARKGLRALSLAAPGGAVARSQTCD